MSHPMTPAMIERIKRIHDAILASTSQHPLNDELEGDFLDLLDSLAGNEGADAKRAAQEAVDEYMDEWDGVGTPPAPVHEPHYVWSGKARHICNDPNAHEAPVRFANDFDPLRERIPTE
jgi:hypothetical protein